MSQTVTRHLAALLHALCMFSMALAYALFVMSPGEAASSPITWLSAITVAAITYLSTNFSPPLKTELRN